jgi:hypothetical protein
MRLGWRRTRSRWLNAYHAAMSETPDTRSGLVHALRRLGLLVLIIHCRPWSYEVLDSAPQRETRSLSRVAGETAQLDRAADAGAKAGASQPGVHLAE